MLNLELDANDDPDFGRAAQTAVLGVLSVSKPPEVYLVKVGNWFGPKWLAFSHKALSALGIASSDLRVPPFVPARVVHEKYFVRVPEGEDYVSAVAPLTLHVRQTSSANAARRISSLCPHAALFWWTGSTHTTGRGGLMAYVPAPSGHAYWYAELTRMTHWRSGAMKGITSDVLATYQAACEAGHKRLVHDGALVPRSRSAPRPAAQPHAVEPPDTAR
jgi:hypothetical protein